MDTNSSALTEEPWAVHAIISILGNEPLRCFAEVRRETFTFRFRRKTLKSLRRFDAVLHLKLLMFIENCLL